MASAVCVRAGDVVAVVALIFTTVAMMAAYLPASRATKVDPVIALRYE